jgi:tetratricopeptide (TPR) repeat protein
LAEAARATRETRASAFAQKRLRQIEKGSEVLASVFGDLDPRAEENEGRPLRAILGDRLDQAAAQLDGDAIGDPLVVAKLQDRLGRTYRALGHAAKAIVLFSKALAIRRAQLGVNHPDTLALEFQQGLALKDAGRFRDSITALEEVNDAQARNPGTNRREILATRNSLAVAYWFAGRLDDACALLEELRDSLVRELAPEDPQTLDALSNLSGVYSAIGKGSEAIVLARQVRDARVKRYGLGHPLAIMSLNNLALRHQAAGEISQALTLFEQARDAIVPKLGADHPKTLDVLDNLSRVYRGSGRTAEAISLAERVHEARVATLGIYHPDTISTLDSLGQAHQAAGEPEKALAYFQQAVIGLEKLDFVHREAAAIVGNLCDCLEKRKQFNQAVIWRRKWLAAVKKRGGSDSVYFAADSAKQVDLLLRLKRQTIASLEPARAFGQRDESRWDPARAYDGRLPDHLAERALPSPWDALG